MLDEAGDMLDLQRLFTRANVVWADGHSNYGNVFATFEERYGADLDGRSTMLIMGDARNNYRDSGLEVLRRLAGRVRHVYWLNPEPQAEWDSTDSIMSTYAPYCDQGFEVRNLRQLIACDVDPDRLRIGVAVHGLEAHLAAIARLADAPEGGARVDPLVAVDPDHAAADRVGDPVRAPRSRVHSPPPSP